MLLPLATQAGLREVDPNEVKRLVDSLTLEQKVGQMIQPEIRYISAAEIKRYGIGSVLNGGGSYPYNQKRGAVTDWLKKADEMYQASIESESGIPIMWGTDAVHGHNNVFGATIFPHNIGLGATNNPALIRQIAEVTAAEVKATGIDWIFAPTVAVAKDFRWGRTYESYSSDADLVASFGKAVVEGIQGQGIAATAKHFIGDGGTFLGRDQGVVKLSLETLIAEHGPGYTAAIEANVLSIMSSFSSWDGQKTHGDKRLLTDVLRGQMGFSNLIVSDWNGVGQVQGCTNANCPKAVNAGIDIIMVPEDWRAAYFNIIKQVKSGEISQARIDEAVTNIISMKMAIGLFEAGKPSTRVSKDDNALVGSTAHRAVARQAVRESLVLLKNNDILPLQPEQQVLLAGQAANDIGMQSGGWTLTWQGTNNTNSDFPNGFSILDSLRAAGLEVTYSESGEYQEAPELAIVVFGETPYAEGQGDKENLLPTPDMQKDIELLQKYKAAGIPTLAIMITGRPLWVNAALNAADAFVVAWLPGPEALGITDVLVQQEPAYDFVGKLPFAWPAKEVNQLNSDAPVDEFLFPLGYGLTYAEPSIIEERFNETQSVTQSAALTTIFKGSTKQPWQLAIGDEGNWVSPVSQSVAQTSMGGLTVNTIDVKIQEDGLFFAWNDSYKQNSQAYWKTFNNTGVDLSSFYNANAAISMILQVNQAPKGKVMMRMDCQWPCRGEMDMTRIFNKLPLNRWLNLSIPLECFKKAGADMTNITSPLVIVADNEFEFSLYNLTIDTEPAANSLLKCPS